MRACVSEWVRGAEGQTETEGQRERERKRARHLEDSLLIVAIVAVERHNASHPWLLAQRA